MLACMAMHPTVHEMREVSRYTMGPNNVLVKMRKVTLGCTNNVCLYMSLQSLGVN